MLCFPSKSLRVHAAVPWAALCFVLAAAGCGSKFGESGTPAAAARTGSERFELDIDRCAGFGPAQAAAILGVPPEQLQDRSQKISEGSRWCILANPGNAEKGVTFTVSRAKSVEEAATEFAQFRQNAGIAAGTLGEPGQKAHEIPGLGDEAVWAPVPGGVYLRKGRYSVQVNQPPGEATQIEIARKILAQ